MVLHRRESLATHLIRALEEKLKQGCLLTHSSHLSRFSMELRYLATGEDKTIIFEMIDAENPDNAFVACFETLKEAFASIPFALDSFFINTPINTLLEV